MTPTAPALDLPMLSYAESVARIHEALGLPLDYAATRRLALVPEATQLIEADIDSAGRPRSLIPAAAEAWRELKAAAQVNGLSLELVSAFRSVDYQRGIVERKRARGLSWEEILRFSAAPGYSEHHSGRAVDINAAGCRALEEEFARTPAFAWLQRNAPARGWRLSFPPDNPHGIAYEPWHWLFVGHS